MDGIKTVIKNVGQPLGAILAKMPQHFAEQTREIRIAAGRPIRLNFQKEGVFIGRSGRECTADSDKDRLAPQEIQNTFAALCKYSVHTYQKDICEGFVTTDGGIRVGICGTAVYENEKIINVKDISALNIRIAREIKGVSDEIFRSTGDFWKTGLLVAGPPCSGKTTVLRDIARQLGNKGICTCVVDERMEIAGMYRGLPGFDIGACTAVLNGYRKSDGIISAVRAMSPQAVICDEFGGEKEIEASLFAMKSGIGIIASMHCLNFEELSGKKELSMLIKNGVFEWAALMKSGGGIEKIIKAEELIK